MEAVAIMVLVFSLFVGADIHKSDLKREEVLKKQITLIKKQKESKSKRDDMAVRNQNIQVVNLGDK